MLCLARPRRLDVAQPFPDRAPTSDLMLLLVKGWMTNTLGFPSELIYVSRLKLGDDHPITPLRGYVKIAILGLGSAL